MPYLCGAKSPRQYVCGGCGEGCLYDGIFCDSCETWRHVACDKVSVKELQTLKELPADVPYICVICRADGRGSFSFDECLKRLHKAAKQGYEKLETCVIRESLFIKKKFSVSPAKASAPKVDIPGQTLIEKYIRNSKSAQYSTPLKTTADGNSLFSAVSLALTAREKFATELRVRCCIEMVMFRSFYEWQQNHEAISLCAPNYIDSCLNCATPGEDSCIWTLSALASVIGTSIKSIYPSVNGRDDSAVPVLNGEYLPRERWENSYKENTVKILWSSKKTLDPAPPPGSWVPDHFVPLVQVPSFQLSPVMTSLKPTRVSGRKRKPTAKLLDMVKTEPGIGTIHMEVMVEDEDEPDANAAEPEDETSSKKKRRKTESLPLENLDLDWQRKYTHNAVGGFPLVGKSFLPVKEIFQIITSNKDPLPSIPKGRKDDIYFIVSNKNNRHPSRRKYFPDDCGNYKQRSGTICRSWYQYSLVDGDVHIHGLNRVDGKFCKETKVTTKMVKGKPVKTFKWIPMDPQPEEDSLMLLHRYYSSLMCDPFYRRRISWFSIMPPSVEAGMEVMVAEYLHKPRDGKGKKRASDGVWDEDEDMEEEMVDAGKGTGEKESQAAEEHENKPETEASTAEEDAEGGDEMEKDGSGAEKDGAEAETSAEGKDAEADNREENDKTESKES